MVKNQYRPRFAVCLSNKGSDDLQLGKLYRVLPDRTASADGYLRVVDDSGEDYLYPARRFVAVKLPAAAARKLLAATSSVA